MIPTSPQSALALLVVVGLAPLASAHACEEGEIGVDVDHGPALICNLAVCVRVPHFCAEPVADVLERLLDPALP